MYRDMKSVAVICVMSVVLWVADEDGSFYENESGQQRWDEVCEGHV
jgi:type III secretory pathway component EscT